MTEDNDDLVMAFTRKMKEMEGITQNDAIYQDSIKSFNGRVKVQWDICGIMGYQIFETDKYTYKVGEELESPDLILKIIHKDLAMRFLNGEHLGFKYIPRQHKDYKGKFEVIFLHGFKETKTEMGVLREPQSKPLLTAHICNNVNGAFVHPVSLLKIPSLRSLKRELAPGAKLRDDEHGSYIPINLPVKYENQIVPYPIFKHFIERASNLVIMTVCGCRDVNACANHDRNIGCLYMGDDTKAMKLTEDKGRVVSIDEALNHVKKGIDNGLIPVIGRVMAEARLYGVEDTGHFLSSCLCCSCCCINGKALTYGPYNLSIYKRMEGVTVKWDETLCAGCGKCVEVCVFRGREMVDGKPKLNPDLCLGCGRCVEACPENANSIEIDDISRIEEMIGKIEKYSDVRPQAGS